MENIRRAAAYPHAPLAIWTPDAPSGRIERIYLHWSGFDYASVFESYHYCVAMDGGEIVVADTHDLRANMRDVRAGGAYAAHTFGRNSYAAGIAVMGMAQATPEDFGAYPLTPELIDALCRVTAAIARVYRIPIDADHVSTHAEAAVIDGYFGAGDDERWDIARLAPDARPLDRSDARVTGDTLRSAIARYVCGD